MTTRIRITRGRSGNYDTLTFEVLSNKGAHMGTITWQGDSKFAWYGLTIATDCDLVNSHKLLSMYKLACYIKDRNENGKPIEIMGIMGGVECFYRNGMFIDITDNGKQVYDVMELGSKALQCRVVAANELMAFRIIDGMVKRKELKDVSYTIKEVGERLQFSPTNLTY